MNPFLNPFFIFRVLKCYSVNVNRLWRVNADNLKKFQDKQLRKLIKYAYTVPFYHEKYMNAGIHPSDIQSTDDIGKLPFISKEDIRKNFPDRIISATTNRTKTVKSYTSGTTGISISIYVDMYTIVQGLLGYVRVIKEHNIDWRKTRMTVIADLSEHSVEREYLTDGVIPKLKPFFSFGNMQIFHTYDDPKKLIKKITSFQPEFIGGYPGMLRQLALLKRRGLGKDIQPRCIISGGSVLDEYLKSYIENSFETRVFDAYGAMESGPMAFQCRQGNYHIHSDLVYLEVVDDNDEPVSPGEPGHLAVTRFYDGGTPIIRYTGLNDIITPTDEICDCGITSGLISEIHGRENQSLVLSGGRILLPSSISKFFGEISEKIDITKIQRSQIIQHKLNKFEMVVLVDNETRKTTPPLEKIFSTIQEGFREKFGPNIDIDFKETDYFKPHTPGIVSKIDKSKIKKKIYV